MCTCGQATLRLHPPWHTTRTSDCAFLPHAFGLIPGAWPHCPLFGGCCSATRMSFGPPVSPQRNTRLGKELSGALVATLAGMALANCGYLPATAAAAHGAPAEVTVVFKFLLPLAIPMLLLSADLRRILRCAPSSLVCLAHCATHICLYADVWARMCARHAAFVHLDWRMPTVALTIVSSCMLACGVQFPQ